jgi:putative transcriptional regulator
MKISEKIKMIRKTCFLSQIDFAKEIGVAFSTVNRWENGRTEPNYKDLKTLDNFCRNHDIKISLTDSEI